MEKMNGKKWMVKAMATAAVVTATLAIGPLPAEARVPSGPRYDSRSIQCGAAQDRADKLVAEYSNPDTTNARKQEILSELRQIADFWDSFCRGTFGSINTRLTSSGSVRLAPSVQPMATR